MVFIFPLTLHAHGESPALISIVGYVFILPLFVGLLDFYLLKLRFEIKGDGIYKSVLINYLITIIGYCIAFYIVNSFVIGNEKLILTLIMTILTVFQVFSKTVLDIFLIKKKTVLTKIFKLLFAETFIINLIFYIIVLIML